MNNYNENRMQSKQNIEVKPMRLKSPTTPYIADLNFGGNLHFCIKVTRLLASDIIDLSVKVMIGKIM